MSVFIPNAFFGVIVGESAGKVYAVLVGDGHGYPQHVGKLVGEVEFLARLGRLVAVGAGDYPRYLATSSARTAMLVSGEKYRTPTVRIHSSTDCCASRSPMSLLFSNISEVCAGKDTLKIRVCAFFCKFAL